MEGLAGLLGGLGPAGKGAGKGGGKGLAGLSEMLGPNANAGDVTQMEQLWKMLDSMAESDPEQYSRYIKEQMDYGKKQEAADRAARTFTPSPGFVVGTELRE